VFCASEAVARNVECVGSHPAPWLDRSNYAEVEAATKSRLYHVTLRVGDTPFPQHIQGHVDDHFFDLFDFPFNQGNEDALDQPYTAAITRSLANVLFPGQDPMEKTVTIEERYYGGEYVVAALLEDPPETSSLQFELLHKTQPLSEQGRDDWTAWQPRVQQAGIQTFLLLRKDVDSDAFELKLPDFIERQMGVETRKVLTYRLQPLLEWHLYSNLDFNSSLSGTGDIRSVYLFAAVAVFILLIAGINYTNLSTARAVTRAREVGLRKTVGAERTQLIRQFLGEAVLMTAIAGILAIVLAQLVLPRFNLLAHTHFALNAKTLIEIVPGLIVMTVLVGLLSGLYPAFVLSGYQPIAVLNTQSPGTSSNARLRKGLVVLQFAISIALLITVGMTNRQLDYVSRAKLGFDKEHVITLPIFRRDRDSKTNEEPWLVGRYNVIKAEFTRHPDVLSATAFRFMPGQDRFFARLVKPEGHAVTWGSVQRIRDRFLFPTAAIPVDRFAPGNRRTRGRTYGVLARCSLRL
jgi:putative ABC transport system permease protein